MPILSRVSLADWTEVGDLPNSASNPGCPAITAVQPVVHLTNGLNQIVAVDRTLYSCSGRPDDKFCIGGSTIVRGHAAGPEMQ